MKLELNTCFQFSQAPFRRRMQYYKILLHRHGFVCLNTMSYELEAQKINIDP